ncbi:MAG: hypothetical protein M0P31_10895 [Solirubrobacteraceae bacterium]|nr:hypothetical protein [Solirubrobacteraceae bacterium]
MRGVDLIVLLDLLSRPGRDWTVRSVAGGLGLPPASVQRAVERLAATPALDGASRRVNRSESESLFVDAARFMFPAHLGAETRGTPTAWGASPLSDALAVTDGVPVWPSPTGTARGFAVDPLHDVAGALAVARPELYEQLTLVDALRLGDARVRGVAADLLRERLFGGVRA